ncbi:hypothetical protein M569_10969 [Genlisea aurea]|uniref:DDT domain-containing protein n=1 Tax=Genlisea aurea TaxID=192259 RepID=S8CAD3_9LAMI|nr:hypothetical protein M569_10969 [Genlisea aurea]
MQALDLPCNPSLDPIRMSEHSSQIHSPNRHYSTATEQKPPLVGSCTNSDGIEAISTKNIVASARNNGCSSSLARRERPSRACTQRATARLQAALAASADDEGGKKKKMSKRRDRLTGRMLKEEDSETDDDDEFQEGVEEKNYEEANGEVDGSTSSSGFQSTKIITPLVSEPEASQLPRWRMRSMWQLASILDFLNVFRPLLNIKVEFSAEELETALITPNKTLADIHIPLIKAIPPVTRMALGHMTWITVLCRKLRDSWHWYAEGDLPIVASHGTEVNVYNNLDPGVRVMILKAVCDIRVEQDDIRYHIDGSIKHGVKMSSFRKERIGGDSHGISYWYEDDPVIGHRLYREIRKIEVNKGKGKSRSPVPHSSYQWETVATNFDEFQNVAEKLFSSKNRTEASVGKKLKNDMLSEIEKVHKRKEKLLKKQHRQALLLDSMINLDGLAAGRSLRDRKPVTYTFDDFDRSINEALKVTNKMQPSQEAAFDGRDPPVKSEPPMNGRLDGTSQYSHSASFSTSSPKSPEGDELIGDQKAEMLDRSNRQRRRPHRYSVKDFVEAVSDNDGDFDSDNDIVGEVVYDDEYLRKRNKRRKTSSSSEGEGEDEEYRLDDEIPEEEEEEEEEASEDDDDDDDNDNMSTSEETGTVRHRLKQLPMVRTRRETKLRSVVDLQPGLRRSKRAARNRINYRQYELSESDTERMKPEKSRAVNLQRPDKTTESERYTGGDDDSDEKVDLQKIESSSKREGTDPPQEHFLDHHHHHHHHHRHHHHQTEAKEGARKRRFLDLNELAPGSGFEEGSSNLSGDANQRDVF